MTRVLWTKCETFSADLKIGARASCPPPFKRSGERRKPRCQIKFRVNRGVRASSRKASKARAGKMPALRLKIYFARLLDLLKIYTTSAKYTRPRHLARGLRRPSHASGQTSHTLRDSSHASGQTSQGVGRVAQTLGRVAHGVGQTARSLRQTFFLRRSIFIVLKKFLHSKNLVLQSAC